MLVLIHTIGGGSSGSETTDILSVLSWSFLSKRANNPENSCIPFSSNRVDSADDRDEQ